jgi:hypothetical protein
MDRRELRIWLDEHFCGCGLPEAALCSLLALLELARPYSLDEQRALIPDEGVRYLVLYMLDHYGLIEHGVSVDGAWPTDVGKALLKQLRIESTDNFEGLLMDHCAHGYDLDEMGRGKHDCIAAEWAKGGGHDRP